MKQGVHTGACYYEVMTRQSPRILAHIRKICLALPETSERPSHGAPTFFIRGKRAFVTYHDNHHGDGRLAIWCDSRDPADAGRGATRALLRPSLRRPSWVAGCAPRPGSRLERDRRADRGRVPDRCA